MFETLQAAPTDKILALIGLYRADPRAGKVDLGVGVYKDSDGRTPVMRAVREAEKRLLQDQDSKTYLGLAGDLAFNAAMTGLVFGKAGDPARIRTAQAPGGSGALRLVAELIQRSRPGASVWMSSPTWPNHAPIMRGAGLKTRDYPYFDATSGTVRFDAMLDALGNAEPGDVVLLHGCCHNPTGANLDASQWAAVADLLARKGLLPFIDIAYQGFGAGLYEDAEAVRIFAAQDITMLISSSFSKSFSLYGERVGALTLVAGSKDEAGRVLSQLKRVIRTNYSNPPTHGGTIVSSVLNTPELFATWEKELAGMRDRIRLMRQQLAEKVKAAGATQDFGFIVKQRGMFSYTGLTSAQVDVLREQHGIYAVSSGRICVAALNSGNIDTVAKAIAAVAK